MILCALLYELNGEPFTNLPSSYINIVLSDLFSIVNFFTLSTWGIFTSLVE